MAKTRTGLVHVYTGNGKGKTSAAMGLAVRAVGQGLRVFIVQFMKGGAYTGEFISAKNFLPNIGFEQFGKHCIKEEKQMKLQGLDRGYHYYDFVRDDIECGDCRFCFLNDADQAQACKDGMEKAQKLSKSEDYDLLVLDEILVAVAFKFVDEEKLAQLIKEKRRDLELVLTGRGASSRILDLADYVSNINEVKHPFNTKKTPARRGIEY
ncbi:MAG: cob(I)yrinic acid a,c-diamide adenosyltransferase [Nanoarchaeota archaeon]